MVSTNQAQPATPKNIFSNLGMGSMTKRKYKLHYSEALGEVLRRSHHNNTSCRDTSFLKGITLHVSKIREYILRVHKGAYKNYSKER